MKNLVFMRNDKQSGMFYGTLTDPIAYAVVFYLCQDGIGVNSTVGDYYPDVKVFSGVAKELNIAVSDTGIIKVEDIMPFLDFTVKRGEWHVSCFDCNLLEGTIVDGILKYNQNVFDVLMADHAKVLYAWAVEQYALPESNTTIVEKIWTNDLDCCFSFWYESCTDLSDEVNIETHFINRTTNYSGEWAVKYMPKGCMFNTDYAIVRVNGVKHLIKREGDWVIFAVVPKLTVSSYTDDMYESLLTEVRIVKSN